MDHVATLLSEYGYWAVLLGTLLEGETVLILAGFAAHRGYLDFRGVVAVAFVGSFAGDQLYFYLGRWKGTAFLARHALTGPIQRVRGWMERRQSLLILGCRFLYGFRMLIPSALGAAGVSPWRFGALNACGALVWALLVTSGGYAFGQALEHVLGDVRRYEWQAMLAIAGAGCAVWVLHTLRRRARRA